MVRSNSTAPGATATDATATAITCTTCGFTFDPSQHPSCGTCPLHDGCSMVCCPNCGVSNINPSGSRLANWLKKILPGEKHHA